MAFFLHTAEVDKARNIAQRALKTISYRYASQTTIILLYNARFSTRKFVF